MPISRAVRTLPNEQEKWDAERAQNIFKTRYGRFSALILTLTGAIKYKTKTRPVSTRRPDSNPPQEDLGVSLNLGVDLGIFLNYHD